MLPMEFKDRFGQLEMTGIPKCMIVQLTPGLKTQQLLLQGLMLTLKEESGF